MLGEIKLSNRDIDLEINLLLENAKHILGMIQSGYVSKLDIFLMGKTQFEEAFSFLKEQNLIKDHFEIDLNWLFVPVVDIAPLRNLYTLITENRDFHYWEFYEHSDLFGQTYKDRTIRCLHLLHESKLLSLSDIVRWLSHENQYEILCEFISNEEKNLELFQLSSLYGNAIFRSQMRNHIMHIRLEKSLHNSYLKSNRTKI